MTYDPGPGPQLSAHWEVLGCALCPLTATANPRTGPVWARGFCPGSHRPRARVPSVVWAWDFCDAASLLRSPGPCSSTVICSAICDCLSFNVSFSLFRSAICDCLSINECFSLLGSFSGVPSGASHHSLLIITSVRGAACCCQCTHTSLRRVFWFEPTAGGDFSSGFMRLLKVAIPHSYLVFVPSVVGRND